MSVAIFIVPEREIEGFDYFVNGKAVAGIDDETMERIFEQFSVASFLIS